jgi:hypothetical protein
MRYVIVPLALVDCAALVGCVDGDNGDKTDLLAYHDGYWVAEIDGLELPLQLNRMLHQRICERLFLTAKEG